MPIAASAPYDNVQYILGLAVAISMDAGPNGLAGNLLNAAQPTTIPLLNKAYRDLQDELISKGVETFSKYWQIIGIPPANTSNPSTLVYLSYTGYFDGQEQNADWFLPPDMLKPLELWERQTGNNFWNPMVQVADAITTRPIMPYYNEWDYQTDILYLPPTNQTNDLQIKGLCYAPDLTAINSPVLVMRCQTALAYRFLMDVSKGRGGLEMAAVWEKDYNLAVNKIVNRSARKEQYGTYFRIPFRRRRSARGRNAN